MLKLLLNDKIETPNLFLVFIRPQMTSLLKKIIKELSEISSRTPRYRLTTVETLTAVSGELQLPMMVSIHSWRQDDQNDIPGRCHRGRNWPEPSLLGHVRDEP